MKGKRPTVAQRRIIENACKLNSSDWLVQKDSPDLLQIVHRYSDKVRMYRKEGGLLFLVGVKGGNRRPPKRAVMCGTDTN